MIKFFKKNKKKNYKTEVEEYTRQIEKESVIKFSLRSNKDIVNELNEVERNRTFVDKMLEYISAKDVKDSVIYKAARIDRRLWSKIVSNSDYKPSKDTCILILIGLELDLKSAQDMLFRAGYALSHSLKRDIAIEYFFANKIYNVDEIDETLILLGEKTLTK